MLGKRQMKESKNERILCSSELTGATSDLTLSALELSEAAEAESDIRNSVNNLISEVNNLADYLGVNVSGQEPLPDIDIAFNDEIDQAILDVNQKGKNYPALSNEELIVSALAGILSVIIDVVLVGTPEVVKIYRGGEEVTFKVSKFTHLPVISDIVRFEQVI